MGDASRCAQLVVTELLGAGVQEVVLSPGSRSAPLAYELFEADKIGLLRLHVRIDERTAGFLALGLAKASEHPVAVVTTSGTAAANVHPAVLEARHSQVPLVVMTADRPRAVRHAGGNQTTDQAGLFARHVRAETQIDDNPATPRSWRFELARVLTAATGIRSGQPGPVHVNLSFSEPLVPGDESAPIQPELRVTPRRPAAEPVTLAAGPQTVVVAGAMSPGEGAMVRAFAEQADLPLLAEPVSNARGGPNALTTGRLLLRTGLGEEIERVVMFGHPTLSRPVLRLLGREDVELVVVTGTAEWLDPGTNARLVADAVELAPAGDDWTRRWAETDLALTQRLRELLTGLDYLSGPVVAARLWAAMGSADTLVIGSSSPVRDLDLAPVSAEPPVVYANRGLAGIDGTVSTAVGVALVVERPTHALVGDETFLHDLTGLIIGRHEPRPDLRIVVANDNGGSIFATLEHGHPTQSGAYERIFGTPHDVDLEPLVTATGAGYRRAGTAEELDEVLTEPPIGVEVVEAVVDRRLRRVLEREIAALGA
ncbi:MAG: 2-succinyl-5-enolpyruvyl-6-hydroxy-3-cyclohexene-1-carboxylic-acid synthase [Microlunatus sp.]|nr:2-succinyl-5-enolpyruvyl-6-hydroxy-3-cyclohexene-1-carboxylic-acid synthase [Microlunatus sp.]MDN5803616.1 2-succinyl-5-enolpyruvyl-6-hydroxy-3-cyclohexene-1-carboxylic-acid synthase [Microlunatus sp.]